MRRTRVLWLMVGFSILLVRTSEGRAADSNKSKGTMSSTTPSSLTSYSSTTDQMTSDTSTPTTTSTSASTTSTASTPTTSAVTSTPASNYTSTENVTSSSTPPPYIDQFGNNLPKVVNASTQYYNETTDIMEALPLVPLEDNGGNAFNGNQAWIIYRIPEGAPNQPMAVQPNQMQNYVSPQIEDLGDTYTCANPQPESQMQQPPGAIRVVLQPVQAFQADYYKVDDSSSTASTPMMKPLNDFFYR